MQRRHALVMALAGAAGLGALGGCGFELRRAPELPFRTLHLTGFKVTSPMGDALRRAIASAAGTRLVDSRAEAKAVLESVHDERTKTVMVFTAAGQVRELQLRERLRFRLLNAQGEELIPETEITQTRDMSYNERDALAKEQEEQLLYRAMQDDMALQVLRRLTAVKRTPGGPR